MDGQAAEIAMEFLDELINQQDLDRASRLCAPGYQHHDPVLFEAEVNGWADFRVVVEESWSRFPGMRLEVTSEPAAAGNKVGLEWTLAGGPLGADTGLRWPDGAPRFISTHRVEGDRVAESWVFRLLPAAPL